MGDHLLSHAQASLSTNCTYYVTCLQHVLNRGRRDGAAHDLAAFVCVVIPSTHERWLMLSGFAVVPLPLSGL